MVDILDIHKKMQHNTISLSFKGKVSVELIDSVLLIISERLDQIEEDINTRKKVYGVLLECLQNLCLHVENDDVSKDYDANSALFMLDSSNDNYQIITANFIPNESVPEMRNTLNEINNLSKEELRQLYNTILRNKTFSHKGGAGLGFVDIARKSNQKLNFDFQTVDAKNTFFSLQININKN
jgi:hypothetical protein